MSEDAEAPVPGEPQRPGEAPAGEQPPAATRRRFRPLRRLFGLLGTVLLLVVVLLLLVLGTQTGLRTAIAVAEELAPGMFSIGHAEGRVLGRLHLEDVEVHVPGLDLGIGSIDLDWTPLAALTGKLAIAELAVRDVDVVAAPSEEEEPPAPIALPEVVIPIRIEIAQALVERLRVSQPGGEEPVFELDRAALSASLDGSDLKIETLDVQLPRPSLEARAQGQATLVGQYPLELGLDWRLEMEPAVELTGDGQVTGDLQQLLIEHQLTGSAQVAVDARVENALDRPSWEGQVVIERVDLPAFKADLPEVEVSGRLETSGDLEEAKVTGSIEGTAPDLPDFGHLTVALDALWKDKVLELRKLDLGEEVSKARLAAGGRLDLNPSPGSFEVHGDWERLRWPLSGDLVAESPKGKVDASGTFEAYDYALSTEAQGPDFPAARVDLTGSGDQQRTQISALKVETLGGAVTADGEMTWSPVVAWNLKVDGKDLNPGEFREGLDDRIGFSLTSEGGLDAFTYGLDANTRGPGLPPARLAIKGEGDIKGTRIETLRLDALDGRVEGRATAAWDPEVGWDAELTAADLNPGAYAPDWPGRIGGRVATKGRLGPDGPDLTASLEAVQGELRGYPVSASGRVALAGKTLSIDGFEAASGPSVARVDGTVADALDIRFDVSSPDLASLAPEAKGSVQAKGSVLGTLEAPEVKLELAAQDAEMAGQRIASLTGTADVGLGPDGRFDIRLDGGGVNAGGLDFEKLQVRGDGSMPDHRLSASASGAQLSFELEGTGGLKEGGAYEGRLARLELNSGQFGAWRMQRPMPVAAAPPKVSAGPLCIRDTGGSGGCVQFDQSEAGKWAASLDLDKLSFELLAPFLPDGLVAEGAARVKGRFEAAGPVLTGRCQGRDPEWPDTRRHRGGWAAGNRLLGGEPQPRGERTGPDRASRRPAQGARGRQGRS